MSMLLMVKAMQTKVGNPLRKLVLIKLADNANDAGECWPSYRHISDQCEIGHSTVRKHIQALAKQGLLTIENRKGALGNTSNLYRLTLDNPMPLESKGVPPNSTPMPPDSIGELPDSIAPMPPDSTRTSHSFESVNEPVNETIDHAPCRELGQVKVIKPMVIEAGGKQFEIPGDLKYPGAGTKSHRTWINYAIRYNNRYGTWPLWNRMTAGVVTSFIGRVGEEVAPRVAAFYLTVNDAYVVKQMHPFRLLLSGAETYHTQYVTNTSMTGTRARQIDQTQSNFDAVDEAMKLLEAREVKHANA